MSADEYRALAGKKPSKYGNKRCEKDGFVFDSLKEMRRYVVLSDRLRRGEITDLEVHPLYRIKVAGVNAEVFRYTPDFRYVENGELVVEDVKGRQATKTEAYGLRKRLMWAIYGIRIREV